MLIYYGAYMNNKLYLDLLNSGTFEFMTMSQVGNFTPIPLFGLYPRPINFPGGAQTVGTYLAVGNQRLSPGFPNICHIAPTGQVIGSTTLSPSPTDLVQFFYNWTRLDGPDAGGATANIYSYPAPGSVITSITSPARPAGRFGRQPPVALFRRFPELRLHFKLRDRGSDRPRPAVSR